MKKSARDNFTSAVIKILERRVNAKCSNPACRLPTSGPTSKPDKANNIGIAAHITAAAPGGPRYNAESTTIERSSIENAIWLCSNCATKIDRDSEKYTVSTLLKWKTEAEDNAANDLSLPPVSRDNYAALESLAFGRLAKKQLPDAVSRIAKLTSAELEKIDSRFVVEVGYNKGTTSYTYNPKHPVDMTFSVATGYQKEFLSKYNDLVNHGNELEIDSGAIKFEGSPLFDFNEWPGGKLFLNSNSRKEAVLKFHFVDAAGSVVCHVADIIGELIMGAESTTFKGKTFGGALIISQKCYIKPVSKSRCTVNFEIDFSGWYGKTLLTLPYFEKVFEFYSRTHSGERVSSTLEIEGVQLLESLGSFNDKKGDMNSFYWTLRHMKYVRGLLKLFGRDVQFKRNFLVSVEDMYIVDEMHAILFRQKGLRGDAIATAKIELVMTEDMTEDEIRRLGATPCAVKIEHNYNLPLKLFDLEVFRPRLSLYYTSAILREVNGITNIEIGKSYTFDVVPSEDCELIAEFLKD